MQTRNGDDDGDEEIDVEEDACRVRHHRHRDSIVIHSTTIIQSLSNDNQELRRMNAILLKDQAEAEKNNYVLNNVFELMTKSYDEEILQLQQRNEQLEKQSQQQLIDRQALVKLQHTLLQYNERICEEKSFKRKSLTPDVILEQITEIVNGTSIGCDSKRKKSERKALVEHLERMLEDAKQDQERPDSFIQAIIEKLSSNVPNIQVGNTLIQIGDRNKMNYDTSSM